MLARKSLLIIGCGYLGEHIARLWQVDGGTVYATTRSQMRADQLSELQINPILFDTENPPSVVQWPQIQHVVISLAPDDSLSSSYQAVYQKGVSLIVESLLKMKTIKSVLYTSSVGVYSETNGEWVDETTFLPLETSRQMALASAEESVLAGPWNCTIYRLGGIYGPTRNRLNAVRKKSPVEFADHYVNLIHVVDAARSSIYLLRKIDNKEIVIGVDSKPVQRGHLVAQIGQWLGVDVPMVVKNTAVSASVSNKRCSNQKLRDLGYEFVFPSYIEGYKNLIQSENKS